MGQVVLVAALASGGLLRRWIAHVVGRGRVLRHGGMAQKMGLVQWVCVDVRVGRMRAGASMLNRLRRVWLQEGVVVTRRQSGVGMKNI